MYIHDLRPKSKRLINSAWQFNIGLIKFVYAQSRRKFNDTNKPKDNKLCINKQRVFFSKLLFLIK